MPAELSPLVLVAEKWCSEGGQMLLYHRPDRQEVNLSWISLTADSQFDWLPELQRRIEESEGSTDVR